ncbi:MAG: carboxypeptidase-like regulatory domain-containing protein [Myxococcales bacterium]|nr:carboxypeptidase-like regulatory domain-containing protein [Myxococcales bacterium]
MSPVLRVGLWTLLVLVAASGVAGAEEPRAGETAAALPGAVRLLQPRLGYQRISVAASAEAAYTEARPEADGGHPRYGGRLAVGAGLLDFLAASLSARGYAVSHDAGQPAEVGWVGRLRLGTVIGTRVAEAAQLGGEIAAELPLADGFGFEPKAISPEARLLGGFGFGGGRSGFFGSVGFRLDRSAQLVDDVSAVAPADRIALDVGGDDAFLFGMGLTHRVGEFEIVGEFTSDLIVGTSASELSRSPLRLDLGLRYFLSPTVQLEWLIEGSLSSRPALSADEALAPVPPRVASLLGVRMAMPEAPPPEPWVSKRRRRAKPPPTDAGLQTEPKAEPKPKPEPKPEPKPKRPKPEPKDPPPQDPKPEPPAKPEPKPEPAPDPAASAAEADPEAGKGVIRGLIRSFAGEGLKATAKVYPGGAKATTGDDGSFELVVDPGRYTVRLRSYGYESQNRTVVVSENGVTILNVDLRKERNRK